MDQIDKSNTVYEGVVVPAAALRNQKRDDKYGHVDGLSDEELADPDELERDVYKEMLWPILRLPQQRWECPIRPNMDEDGKVNWGAYGTVDFESYRPQFSKLRYKTTKLKERLTDLVMTCEMIRDRIQGLPVREVLKKVRDFSRSVQQTDDITMMILRYHGNYRLIQQVA